MPGRGYGTNTAKWSMELADGRRTFVKHALDEPAADWLRLEYSVYASVRAQYMARLLGWHDENGSTFLAIEDLTDAYWPPPWTDEQIDAFLATLDEVHRTEAPAGLRVIADRRDALNGWLQVADDSRPFLSLGLCSHEWLEAALPELLHTAVNAPLAGEAFLHMDARSDNACFRAAQAILVDWNWASIGNPLLDVVAWLPSLRLEGGPEPWTIVEDSDGLAALIAGYFSAHAPLPAPAAAPAVREFQREQAVVALPWAARELGLPPPTLRP